MYIQSRIQTRKIVLQITKITKYDNFILNNSLIFINLHINRNCCIL